MFTVLCLFPSGHALMANDWYLAVKKIIFKTEKTSIVTGFVCDDFYLLHNPGETHLEKPARLESILKELKDKNLFPKLLPVKPSPAKMEWITEIHSPDYVRKVKDACRSGQKHLPSPDTGVSKESFDVALLAVGGVLEAIDAVMNGKVKNAFCAVRPPGHHALKDKAMGFCLFNNVAIGARYLQRKYNLKKIFIVDWDVHHGNGTQDAFYDDPSVFYFSVHQYPFYPGSGASDERGAGKGYGYNLNVPLPAGSGDEACRKIFQDILKPKIIEFKPDFILISAGFDAHKDDPLGGMQLTPEGFAKMTAILKEQAEITCNGRIVSVLEGGYDLEGLSKSVAAHIVVLLGDRSVPGRLLE
jgi:acetoin utilization deacetylase AcuC-like enzyme